MVKVEMVDSDLPWDLGFELEEGLLQIQNIRNK